MPPSVSTQLCHIEAAGTSWRSSVHSAPVWPLGSRVGCLVSNWTSVASFPLAYPIRPLQNLGHRTSNWPLRGCWHTAWQPPQPPPLGFAFQAPAKNKSIHPYRNDGLYSGKVRKIMQNHFQQTHTQQQQWLSVPSHFNTLEERELLPGNSKQLNCYHLTNSHMDVWTMT